MRFVALLPPASSPDHLAAELRRVLTQTGRRAGFEADGAQLAGIELTLSESGPVSVSGTTQPGFTAMRTHAPPIVGLACDGRVDLGLMAVDEAARALTCEVLVAGMRLARDWGAETMTCRLTPAGTDPAECWRLARDSLLDLRFAAEDCAVRLLLDVGRGHFPVSPTECREFVDELTTPWVQLSLGVTHEDLTRDGLHDVRTWQRLLGPRLARVAVKWADDDVAAAISQITSSALVTALRASNYNGTIVVVRPEHAG